MMLSRRGVSIVELLVVMSASTVVLSLTSVLIVRAMQHQMQARALEDVERNSLRLSEQFRRDVHQAQKVVPRQAGSQGGALLQLELVDDTHVEYRVEDTGDDVNVLRLAVTSGKPKAREEFVFPGHGEVKIRELDSPRRIALMITTTPFIEATADGMPPVGAVAIPVSFAAEAVVGADLRFAVEMRAREGAP